MMNGASPEELIKEMMSDSRRFAERGRAHDLLQWYFAGYPLETLRPLLGNLDPLIQRSASYIVSELGAKACLLLDDIIPVLGSPDVHAQYYAAEAMAVCCRGDVAHKYVHVLQLLEAPHAGLRSLVAELLRRADDSQREAIRQHYESCGEVAEARRWARK